MEEDTPPKPPDPKPSREQSHDAPDASRQSASSRKRPAEPMQPTADSGKKTATDPSQGTPSIQNIFIHSSFAEGAKDYSGDDKGPFIAHVCREVPDQSAGIIRPLNFGQFLHTQCLNCCRFGHIKAQCRSQPRCYRCAQPHSGDSCDENKEKASCLHCSGGHFASDRDCPEFSRQQNIKLVMSQDNISYAEASTRFPPVRRSYAETAREMFSSPTFSPRHVNAAQPNKSKSYRETVTRSPRPRTPTTKGYDKQSHQTIINSPSSSLLNGCALGDSQADAPASQGRMLEHLSALLLSIIAPCSELPQ